MDAETLDALERELAERRLMASLAGLSLADTAASLRLMGCSDPEPSLRESLRWLLIAPGSGMEA